MALVAGSIAVVLIALSPIASAGSVRVPDLTGTWVVVTYPEFMKSLVAKTKGAEIQLVIKQSDVMISTTQRLVDTSTTKVLQEFPPTAWYPDGRDIRSVRPDRTVKSTRTTWEGETLVSRTVTLKAGREVDPHTVRMSLDKAGMLQSETTIEDSKGRPIRDRMVLKRQK